ncbi:hypothetical protein GVAV_001260 [Gurleya vavrai]
MSIPIFMFLCFVKFLFFQYNQIAHSLIDFGVLNDIEAENVLDRKYYAIEILVIAYKRDIEFGYTRIYNQLIVNLDLTIKTRNLIFSTFLTQIEASKTNQYEFNILKAQIHAYIYINFLFYKTYDKIYSALIDEKAYPESNLDLHSICDFFSDIPKKIFIIWFSFDYYLLGISKKLFAKDKFLVNHLLKHGMHFSIKTASYTYKFFEKKNFFEFPDDLLQA